MSRKNKMVRNAEILPSGDVERAERIEYKVSQVELRRLANEKSLKTRRRNKRKLKWQKFCFLSLLYFFGLLIFIVGIFGLDMSRWITKEVTIPTVQVAHAGEVVKEIGDSMEVEEKPTYKEVWKETVRVTAYSEFDSCHFPDGKGGCLNAYNKTIQDGEIACPRWVKKGTRVSIDGLGDEFVCMDKTANWVQSDRGTTFDVWFGYGQESYDRAIKFGTQRREVTILKSV